MDYLSRFSDLFAFMEGSALAAWREPLERQLRQLLEETPHGDMPRWQQAVEALPDIPVASVELDHSAIKMTSQAPLSPSQEEQLHASLKQLSPWRKGPFELFSQYIDTEWRSDWKWERLVDALSPLDNRLVLDVGCGSGYHMWRMLGAGAARVIGVDPLRLFMQQFEAVKTYAGREQPVHLLPLKMEDVPAGLRAFDTVFSMGVLYHRKSPLEHLNELFGALRSGGELVLETLVIDGGLGEVLMPENRYAQMRNVWFIPSVETLLLWLRRTGFKNARLVDLNQTSLAEQRQTEWMQFHSLEDFLDGENPSLTVEGYPAPLRAVIVANA